MKSIVGGLRFALEVFGGFLLVMLTLLVTIAATLRFFGAGLPWYDEVAPILLTWLTYFGAALVALNRGHLGFDNIIRQLPVGWRALAFTVSEGLTITFFLALAWGGVRLMYVISDERLMTVDWFPSSVAQSVIPIASIIFVTAEIVSLPMAWKKIEQSSQGSESADYLS